MKANLAIAATLLLSVLFMVCYTIKPSKPVEAVTQNLRPNKVIVLDTPCDSVVRLRNDLIGVYRDGQIHIEKIKYRYYERH